MILGFGAAGGVMTGATTVGIEADGAIAGIPGIVTATEGGAGSLGVSMLGMFMEG